MSSTQVSRPRRARRQLSRWQRNVPLMALLFALGYFFAGTAWSWASAIGSSPDDDYHLASIWCPPPLDGSGCVIGHDAESGRRTVVVPIEVAEASCYAFHSNTSAACQHAFPSGETKVTARVDDGSYPGQFYQVLHLLTGPDVNRSVIAMRMLNVAIAAIMLGLAFGLVQPRQRRVVVTVAVATMVPTTISFVASTNPTSWAITGIMGVWFGCMALFSAESKRRMAAGLGLLVAGALLAAGARADSGAYVGVVVTAATIVYFRQVRSRPLLLLPLAVIVVVGALSFLSSGQNNALEESTQSYTNLSSRALLYKNLLAIPHLLMGTMGAGYGLGWFDTYLPSMAAYGGVFAVLLVIFIGLGNLWLRKALGALLVLGVAIALPIYVLQVKKIELPADVQPRYVLPLIIVLVAIMCLGSNELETFRLSHAQAWTLWLFVNLTNTFALHTQMNRYTTGLGTQSFNPNYNLEWWWRWGPSPLKLWLFGSVVFAVWSLAVVIAHRAPAEATDDLAGEVLPAGSTVPGETAAQHTCATKETVLVGAAHTGMSAAGGGDNEPSAADEGLAVSSLASAETSRTGASSDRPSHREVAKTEGE